MGAPGLGQYVPIVPPLDILRFDQPSEKHLSDNETILINEIRLILDRKKIVKLSRAYRTNAKLSELVMLE